MVDAALHLLSILDPPRRAAVRFAFTDQERYRWNYRPDGFVWEERTFWHEGLRLVNMTETQQHAAFALLASGLGVDGGPKARAIMMLERHLREAERVGSWAPHFVRDPELYAFAIFGDPGGDEPWAWRVGGHHLGVHFTLVDGDRIAPTPLFFGANPAEVRHGSSRGLRTLPEEEEHARELLRCLGPRNKARALVSDVAPGDIVTDAYRDASPAVLPEGVPFGALTAKERDRLIRLVRLYVDRTADEIATLEWRKIEDAGLESITFAWAGGEAPGEGHYYCVKGPTFAIEYDNTQDGANHAHSVWRSFTGDWGEDLLAQHYREAHQASVRAAKKR
ncbi:Hypothetical protein A7982_11649 [Minicystis rosea]|nr:Hypothetical protein A7982_11649 [Minicystis rosea]